jgi:hypothetical protein
VLQSLLATCGARGDKDIGFIHRSGVRDIAGERDRRGLGGDRRRQIGRTEPRTRRFVTIFHKQNNSQATQALKALDEHCPRPKLPASYATMKDTPHPGTTRRQTHAIVVH